MSTTPPPLAPLAARAPLAPNWQRQTFVERRNYTQLKWRKGYEKYYQRNWDNETTKYLNKVVPNKFNNWNWCHYINPHKNLNIPQLANHTTSDVGNKLVTIGDRKKVDKIDVYEFTKDFSKAAKLKSNGRTPCCRFAHTAEYIAPINSILFFGGFDSKCNFNDARLYCLDNSMWCDLEYNTDILFRAYHTMSTRIIYKNNINKNKQNTIECYIFGGQYCSGGPYTYHNDIFRITFYDGSCDDDDDDDDDKDDDNQIYGWYECEELQINGANKPCPRSQCYSFISDNKFYIYGGCIATKTLNDLWILDLNTLTWNKINLNNDLLGAPITLRITPKNFRVFPARKPCYYDPKLNALIVIHFGTLTPIQSKYMEYDDCLQEFEERIKTNKINQNDKIKRRKGRIMQLMDSQIFIFDLSHKRWNIIKPIRFNKIKPKIIPSTCFVRIGNYLILFGGGYKKKKKNKHLISNNIKNLYLLKIPNTRKRKMISWSRERLLWIAHYKNKNIKNLCYLSKCPKDIILLIVGFFITDSF